MLVKLFQTVYFGKKIVTDSYFCWHFKVVKAIFYPSKEESEEVTK